MAAVSANTFELLEETTMTHPKPLAHQFKFASHSSPGTREADFENTLVCRELKKDVYTKFNGGFLGVGGGGGWEGS